MCNQKYVIWNDIGTVKGTLEDNYNARIRNERLVNTFNGMSTEEAREYVSKNFSLDANNIIIK